MRRPHSLAVLLAELLSPEPMPYARRRALALEVLRLVRRVREDTRGGPAPTR